MKFPVKDFFSKCDKIMENFIFLCSGIIKTMVGYERTFKSDSQSLAAVTKQLNNWVSGLMNKLNYTLMVLRCLVLLYMKVQTNLAFHILFSIFYCLFLYDCTSITTATTIHVAILFLLISYFFFLLFSTILLPILFLLLTLRRELLDKNWWLVI